ncbi:MT-A70 family methyltransferase [Nocardia sp. NPDC046473]|uniref:MT-A70 family methyltransferase n=1 Tax=Nocardia sp. NPDC046473 TaxID=3155733 RepID=UPI00340EF5FE
MTSDGATDPGTSRRYRTILADPPWGFAEYELLNSPRYHGPVTLHQLKALPVSKLAQSDAYLWMWCTTVTLRAAYEVLEAWEFAPRAPLTWIKPCPGLDTHLRSRTEHLILGTRGNAEVNDHGQPVWMFAPVHDHQHRSDEEYAVIERVSTGPYLELFASRSRCGWDAWRGQISSGVERCDDYPRVAGLRQVTCGTR